MWAAWLQAAELGAEIAESGEDASATQTGLLGGVSEKCILAKARDDARRAQKTIRVCLLSLSLYILFSFLAKILGYHIDGH
jgi:hypothetical protein